MLQFIIIHYTFLEARNTTGVFADGMRADCLVPKQATLDGIYDYICVSRLHIIICIYLYMHVYVYIGKRLLKR